jgi:glc operon protein GlcG
MSTRSRLVTSAVAAGVVAFAAAGVMAQQVNPKLVITGKEAEDIGESNMINAATAEAISHACEKMAADHGQNAAIVITDIFGNVVHEHRMDGAARFTAISTAELKAKTARLTRRATSLRQYNVERNPNEVAREFGMGYFPTGGGLPIWAGKQIIGFIGVGGQAPRDGWSDEMCAWQALNQVVGQQPALPQAPPRQQRAGN